MELDSECYLQLPSNTGAPTNKSNDFTINLPFPLIFKGEFEMGLAEILYTPFFDTVYEPISFFIEYENGKIDEYVLPPGAYSQPSSLLSALQSVVTKAAATSSPPVTTKSRIPAPPAKPSAPKRSRRDSTAVVTNKTVSDESVPAEKEYTLVNPTFHPSESSSLKQSTFFPSTVPTLIEPTFRPDSTSSVDGNNEKEKAESMEAPMMSTVSPSSATKAATVSPTTVTPTLVNPTFHPSTESTHTIESATFKPSAAPSSVSAETKKANDKTSLVTPSPTFSPTVATKMSTFPPPINSEELEKAASSVSNETKEEKDKTLSATSMPTISPSVAPKLTAGSPTIATTLPTQVLVSPTFYPSTQDTLTIENPTFTPPTASVLEAVTFHPSSEAADNFEAPAASSTSQRQAATPIAFQYDSATERASIVFKNKLVKQVRLNEDLGYMLGMSDSILTKSTRGKWRVDLRNNKTCMFIYADCIQNVIVGDGTHNLLRIVPLADKNTTATVSSSFHTIQYCKLRTNMLTSVRIMIMDELGRPLKFTTGPAIVTLHLRRCQ